MHTTSVTQRCPQRAHTAPRTSHSIARPFSLFLSRHRTPHHTTPHHTPLCSCPHLYHSLSLCCLSHLRASSYLTFLVLFYFAVDVSAFRSLSLIRSLSIATSLSAVIVFIWWSFFEKSLEELLFHHSMNSCVCEGLG